MKKISSGIVFFVLFFAWNNTVFAQSVVSPNRNGESFLTKAKGFSHDMNIDSAEYYYLKAIEYFEQKNLWDSVIVAHINLSVDVFKSGRYESAKERIATALRICEQHKESQYLLAKAYIAYSYMYMKLDMIKEAEIYLDSANVFMEKIEDAKRDLEAEMNLTYSYAELAFKGRDYDRTLLYAEKLKKAFESFSKIDVELTDKSGGFFNDIAYSKWCYAKHFYRNNQDSVGQKYFEEAIEDYKKAIDLEKSSYGISSSLAHYINNYAMIYDDIYIYEKDEKSYKTAHDLYAKSLRYKIKTLPKYHPDIARNYMNIGALYYEHEDYNNALRNLHKTLQSQIIDFDSDDTHVLPDINSGILDANRVLYALKKKAAVFQAMYETSGNVDDLALALDHIKLCVSVIAKIRHLYTTDNSKLYLIDRESGLVVTGIEIAAILFKQTGKQSYLEEALDLTQKMKSILLYETIQRRDALEYSTVPSKLKDKEFTLRKTLSALKSGYLNSKEGSRDDILERYIETRESYDELVKDFEREHPVFYKDKYKLPNFSRSQIVNKALKSKPHTLIVQYIVGDEYIYTFGISSEKISIDIIPRGEIEVSVDTLVQIVRDTKPDNASIESFAANAFYLNEHLLKPALSSFDNDIEKLIIIPDNFLNNVPFECLLSKLPTENLNYIDLPYLLRDYTFSYSPSLSLFTKIFAENKKRKNSIVAFAPEHIKTEETDTTCDHAAKIRNGEMSLPFAKEEVAFLREHFGAYSFTGKKVSETQFKEHAPDYGIIHIATHAIVDNEVPENSRFIFSSIDSLNDGELELWEIHQMKLNASLAFLSACETGLGKIEQGEGTISLARSFFVAGCPSVIMSLWRVDDKSTSITSKQFYNYLNMGHEKDEALRTAKLDYIKRGETSSAVMSHPYYWAGLICMGDTKAVFDSSSHLNYILFPLFLLLMFYGVYKRFKS